MISRSRINTTWWLYALLLLLIPTAAWPGPSQPIPGAAKEMTIAPADGLPETITIGYVFENFGTQTLFAITVTEDFTTVFGTHSVDWTFTSIASSTGTIHNPGFNGNSDTELVNQAPTQSLTSGEVVTVTVEIELLTSAAADLNGFFCNQITLAGVDSAGSPFSDVSDNGTDPDANGNGDPTEAGDNDPSCFNVTDLPVELQSFTVE